MSFQIRTIAVYAPDGRLREIGLRLGRLNVITGASKTGKSSLLDIIDYCLASSDYPIAAGVLRTNAYVFALRLTRESQDLLVARFAPRPGSLVSTQFHLRSLSSGSPLPNLEALTANADLASARAELAAFAGIRENLHVPEAGSRPPLRASIRHSLFFCLQAQDEVASRSVLFHSQAGEHTPQAMRDVLPYFLGAVSADHLARVNRLREIRRELRLLGRAASERDRLRGPSGREEALIAEAVQVGLLEEGATRGAPGELLVAAMNAPEPYLELPGPSSFAELVTVRQRIRAEHSRTRASLDNLRIIAAERNQFASEAGQQMSRLSVAALFSLDVDESTCPVCASTLNDTATVEDHVRALAQLQDELVAISTTTPEIDSLVATAEDHLSDLQERLRVNQLALDEVERGNRLLSRFQEAAIQRAVVRGRISLFLSAQPDVVVDGALDERIGQLQAAASALEGDLDADESAARLDSLLSRVNSNITEIANYLELEHSDSPTRLDIRRLTVIADRPEGPVPLDKMGSGENWVGYHIATMLGLHRFFADADRPVPRFLFLDQPSQVYFPADNDDEELENDEDRQALERMLRATALEVERQAGRLQVIVVDHADLAVDFFREAVLERWRGGSALIPAGWLELD